MNDSKTGFNSDPDNEFWPFNILRTKVFRLVSFSLAARLEIKEKQFIIPGVLFSS
jgi:hypothetical protein